MRLRSARTLVFSRESGGLLGLNFLTGSEFACSPDLLTLLAMLDDWTEFDHIVESLPAMSRDELHSSIEALIISSIAYLRICEKYSLKPRRGSHST